MPEGCSKREKFAVSQQILADDQVRAERSRMVEREKAEFFRIGDSQESDKEQAGTHHPGNSVQEPIKFTKSQDGKLQAEESNTEPSSKLAV